MKMNNDTIELLHVLTNLKQHLNDLIRERQPLTAEEIQLLRQLEPNLPKGTNVVDCYLLPSIAHLLKRSKASKKNEDSATLNFPLPKSSETKSNAVEAKKAGAQVLLTELIWLLQTLMQAREQRKQVKVAAPKLDEMN